MINCAYCDSGDDDGDDDDDDDNGDDDDDDDCGEQEVSNRQKVQLSGFGLIILKRIWNFLIALIR